MEAFINDDYSRENSAVGPDLSGREIRPYDALTGGDNINRYLYYQLKMSMAKADSIDIIVSFLMESGVRMLLSDLKAALERRVKIRILTGNYLGITQPSALYLIKSELGDRVDLRFFTDQEEGRSFHPKAYIFHFEDQGEIYIGSSNISRSALTSGIEWNYRLRSRLDEANYRTFYSEFENLYENHSIRVTDEVLKTYSASWHRPAVSKDIERYDRLRSIPAEFPDQKIQPVYQPRGAQIEALYALRCTREEGADKALVVAATGIGKTYLAAFDSQDYERVLFVAHREEILNQAAAAFRNVRKSDDYGFFRGSRKDTDKAVVFASVASLGKEEYLNDSWFPSDYFQYIVVDEFHHAVNDQYRRIVSYFKPRFLLGLTATPERMDARNIYEICDYNVPYEIDLGDAINKGMLAPFHYYGIYDATDYSGLRVVKGHYQETDLDKLYLTNRARFDLIWKYYEKYPTKRALGFCSSRKHAEEMARQFNLRGCPAAAVYSSAQGEFTEERDLALKGLREGTYRVIFSVDMFNEGVDVPGVDMILFLRPTESPVVFLQQLGRGLRVSEGKKFCNVLDFIGNYRKAGGAPALLSGQSVMRRGNIRRTMKTLQYPDDCVVDFDMRLVDLFEEMEKKSRGNIRDRIVEEYFRVRDLLGHVPTRTELFTYMSDEIYTDCQNHGKYNPFRKYLDFLHDLHELDPEEERIYGSLGREFLKLLETTNMTRVYKMPVLMAFYNDGDILLNISEAQVLAAWKAFFEQNGNWKDLHPEKGVNDRFTFADYRAISDHEHLKKIKEMPVHFLEASGKGFFVEREGAVLGLQSELETVITLPGFADQMQDVIRYRTMDYYRRKYSEKRQEWEESARREQRDPDQEE